MRHIDMQTWSRREHFKVFGAFDHPHFSMCANVDLTAFYPFVKQHGISFNVATVYVLARAANAIPEFRYRIRSGEVVEHEIVHPATTILMDEDLFTFCTFDYNEDFSLFAARAAEQIAYVKEHLTLEDEPGRDSVPRFAWGKFFEDGEFLKMPLDVQAHHALMDGVHMGRYFAEVEDYLHRPEVVLGAA
jgi:chloramphenicol O-acetyltransferase type A